MFARIKSVVDYIAILLIILDCYSVVSISGTNGEIVKFAAIVTLIVSFLLHSISGIKINKNAAIFLLIYIFAQSVFIVFNKPSSSMAYFINQVLIVGLAVLCFSNKSFFLTFWEKYRNIMLVICCCSLFFYILGTVLSVIPSSGTINATWGTINIYKNWYFLYNEAQRTWFLGLTLVRNIGIFSEGPMFSYCICFAVWCELFNVKFNKYRFAIFIITILTTFSMTGVLFVATMIFIKYFEYTKKVFGKLTRKRLFMFILLMIISVIGIYFVSDKLDSVSGISRANQYLLALKRWSEAPYFGVGYKMSNQGGYASGILLALAECGIFGSLLYFIPLIGSTIKSDINNNFKYLSFALGFAGILLLTVVPYKIITLCAVSYLWMYLFGVSDNYHLNSKEV